MTNIMEGGAPSCESVGEAEAGDYYNKEYLIKYYYDILCKQNKSDLCMVVFAPYDKTYLSNFDWYTVGLCDKCRKLIKLKPLVIVRHTLAKKLHCHGIYSMTEEDAQKYSGKACNKFKLNVSRVYSRQGVLDYIFKEKSVYYKYIDFI